MTTINNKKCYPSEKYLNELITNIEFAARAPVEVVRAIAAELQKHRKAYANTAASKDGWISCSERMPEKGQNVLISVNFDSSLVEPLICSARYTGSTFRRGEATIKPGNGIEQATHWMPLPEPPQEVNRG
ncbi:DUF551 domain-containing protein [Escherichia marmotae]|nr:DUF551 domain-containing protein [Escherichia marmotae]